MSQFKNIGKIGIGIVAFEGTEHLYNIISELRLPTNIQDTNNYNLVDTVVICLQKVGYEDNRKVSNLDLNECIRLRDEDHLVDEILFPELDTTKKAREQETDKRNYIIDVLREKYGCDYAIIIDSDEYYTHRSFKRACELIDENEYPVTYCEYCNYFGTNNPRQTEYSYRMLMKYPFSQGMFVPFLIKTDYHFKFNSTDFNRPSDPTRRVSLPVKEYKTVKEKDGSEKQVPVFAVNYTIIPWDVCKMHHFSWLRADIRKKLEAWSSKKLFDNYNDLIDRAVQHFKNFDIKDPNPQALMLFNTPENKVDIQILDKQYIRPKADYRTRLRPAKDYKKLLVLSMGADIPIFNELDKASNETWRNINKEKYPNVDVDFWTYTDAPDSKSSYVDKEHHIIYIEKDKHFKDDLLYATTSKTVEALFIIRDELKLDYDYLVRTNTSTWINIPLVNEILAYEHDDSIIYGGQYYAAFWSAFNTYARGNMMIFSSRQIRMFLDEVKSVEHAKKIERTTPGCDDNVIFGVLNARNMRLKIPYSDIYKSIGTEELLESHNMTDYDKVDFTAPAYQIKTSEDYALREESDIKKMKHLDMLWNSTERDIESLYRQWKERCFDDTIIVITKSKSEWLTDNCVKDIHKPEYVMNKDYALKEYLPKRQKECGYPSGIFI